MFWNKGSISARLTRMNVLVGATALFLAFVSFFSLDLFSYRQNLVQSLGTEAQILGSNSVSALLFDDPQAAQSTLSALQNSPFVLSAVVLAHDGQRFAVYQRDPGSGTPLTPSWDPSATTKLWTQGSNILLGERIIFRNQELGTIYILSATTEIAQRARLYTLMAGAILLLCLVLALLATARFRRVIAEPLMNLAQTARIVSTNKDYSLRAAPVASEDEFASLVESFNEMLNEIQQRDIALTQSKQELETRVQERTAELIDANKELEAFSYSVAHDLRGPLDTIGNLSFLLRDVATGKLGTQTDGILDELPRAAHRMSSVVGDLLNLSRSRNAALHRQPVDLSDMAKDIERELRMGEPERVVQFKIAPGVKVIADKGLIRIALYNLLCNAWKYSSKVQSPCIEFGVTGTTREKVFFVRDNGAGFDEQFAHRLFKPFERLHTDVEFPGTGVGLATVRRIINRHGGEIWAAGQVDEGATFSFTLPN